MKHPLFTLGLALFLLGIAVPGMCAESEEAAAEKRIDVIVAALDGIAPAGYEPAGPIERYNVGNIYDKINGRSELHMAYGVVGLAYARFEPAEGEGAPVEVFLYDMGSVLGAFGAFSVERWEEGEEVEVGREAYRHRDDLSFWHGPYYANVVGRAGDTEAEAAQEAVAAALVRKLEDPGDTLWGEAWLPAADRVPHSLQYYREDALSLDFLTDTFTARYNWNGEEYTVFVSRQPDEAHTKAVMAKLREYHSRYSDSVQTVTTGQGEYLLANIGGDFHDVATVSGSYLFGVTTVEGREEALAAAERLHEEVP